MIFLKNNQCAVRALHVMTGEMLSQISGNPTQLQWAECPWVAQHGIPEPLALRNRSAGPALPGCHAVLTQCRKKYGIPTSRIDRKNYFFVKLQSA